MPTSQEKFEQALRLRDGYHSFMEEVTSSDVFTLFEPVFEQNPDLRAVFWTQYTPGFNDGDPCVFDRNELQVILEEDLEDETKAEDLHEFSVNALDEMSRSANRNKVKGLKEVSNLLFNDLAEVIFGDGRGVIVTREKITSQDYECGY